MLKIIIVEDNSYKAYRITDILLNIEPKVNFEIYTDTNSARKALKKKKYDLIILDISLPRTFGQKVYEFGGVELLNSLYKRTDFFKPDHIIGFTKYKDVLKKINPLFKEKLLSVIEYKADSMVWENQLLEKLDYLIGANNNSKSFLKKIVSNRSDSTIVDNFINWAKNNIILSFFILFVIVLVGISSFTDAVKNIKSSINSLSIENKSKEQIKELGIEFSEKAFFEKINSNDTIIVKLFLNAGMLPNTINANGKTPLSIAIDNNYINMLRILLKSGAVRYNRYGNMEDNILYVIEQDKLEVLKTLLEYNNTSLINKYPEMVKYSLNYQNYKITKIILVDMLKLINQKEFSFNSSILIRSDQLDSIKVLFDEREFNMLQTFLIIN